MSHIGMNMTSPTPTILKMEFASIFTCQVLIPSYYLVYLFWELLLYGWGKKHGFSAHQLPHDTSVFQEKCKILNWDQNTKTKNEMVATRTTGPSMAMAMGWPADLARGGRRATPSHRPATPRPWWPPPSPWGGPLGHHFRQFFLGNPASKSDFNASKFVFRFKTKT